MRIYRINKFTGAIRQVFGKPKELTGKALEADNAFAERMGVAKVSKAATKVAAAIKSAPVVQKVGMAVATVAVAGGTAAGIVATHQPAPTPVQPSTPAITQPKAEETKPEEKPEEKPAETKPEEKPAEEKPAATEQPAAPTKQEYEYNHQPAEEKPAESHEAAPAPAPVPTTPKLLGYKHILSAWNPDTNEIYRTTYGYDGEYGSREEAMQALIKMINDGGKATPRGIEESEVPIYAGRD